jgi:hypothetical protein
MLQKPAPRLWPALVLALSLPAFGCQALVSSATRPMLDGLKDAVSRQRDVQLVKDAAPSYVLLADGLALQQPDNPEAQRNAAQLYALYANAFVDNATRAAILWEKSLQRAKQAMALENEAFARRQGLVYAKFEPVAATISEDQKETLFALVAAWAGYLKSHAGDFSALTDLPKLTLLADRLLELAPDMRHGAPRLIKARLLMLLPPAYGGDPEAARLQYDKALALTGGAYLPALVAYAEHYAKPLFKPDLFQRLLRRVLDADPAAVPDMTLANTMAQNRARELLRRADDYF